MKHNSYKKTHQGIGWLCIVIGLVITSSAVGLLPINRTALHVPMWVFFLCGGVFFIAGVMVLNKHNSKMNNILGIMLLIAMGSIGSWIAIFGESESFSGGIPFIPDEYNVILARLVFGSGAIIVFLYSAYSIRKLLKKNA